MNKKRDYAVVFRYLSAFLLLAIIFITILQVFFRFVLDSPLTWTDEISRFFLIWMTFIGAAVVSFDDKHLAVNMFQENMSQTTYLITTLIMRTVIIAFLLVVIVTSIDVVRVAHYQTSGALEIPFSYWRAAAPVGSALMIIFTLIRTVIDIKKYRQGSLLDNNEQTKELS